MERKEFLQRCFYSHGQFDDDMSVGDMVDSLLEEEKRRLDERPAGARNLMKDDEEKKEARRTAGRCS